MANPTEENQLNVQGYNIVTILKRLEAATSRLEDITIFHETSKSESPESGSADSARGETAKSVEPLASAGSSAVPEKTPAPSAPTAPESASVRDFKHFVAESVAPFVAASQNIDPVVGECASALQAAFDAQAAFLELVARTKKPAASDPQFLQLLAPINSQIEKIVAAKDANRRSSYFNHLNTISEGAPVLGWIVSDTPVSYIPEFKDSAQFWSNRVMKEYKDKDAAHVEWVKQFLAIFDALRSYVKEHHATGPSWNANGKPLAESVAEAKSSSSSASVSTSGSSATSASASSSSSTAGGPPPPPPPPPAALFEEASQPSGMNAVFADLNRGSNVTSGLKKVEKSQMTHKNPELRAHGAGPKKPTPPKKPQTLSTNVPKKKPARKELVDGIKWMIENYTEADTDGPIVIDTEMLQSVFIGKTSGITVQIVGKGNAVSISETKNTAVVVDSLVSGIDVIKSQKFGIQVTGVVPLVTVDKSDEGSVYLSQQSVDADTHVVTSNTTALNVYVPRDDDFVELAVPEQLLHSIKNGKLVSEVVEHAG